MQAGHRRWFTGWRGWLALGLLGVGLMAPAQAGEAAAQRVLTVVIDDNYPPYSFRDDGGRLQGLRKDVWALWSARTGVSVQLVGQDWAKAQETIRAGQADVIDMMFKTPARQTIYEFGPAYSSIDVPIFFHDSLSGVSDAQSLKGFTIGVKEGDACVDYLASQGLSDFRKYPSYEAVVDAAAVGEVRVFCEDRPPAMYFLVRKQLDHLFRVSQPLFVGQFHWAVRKGDQATLQLIKEGFDRISPAEMREIEDRWLGVVIEPHTGVPIYVRYGLYVLLAIGGVLIVLGGWNLALRRRVAQSTTRLSQSLQQLTEAKQKAEQTLAQLDATLGAIPDLLFEMDLEGRYVDVRVQRDDLLAAPKAFLKGRSVHEVMPAEAAETAMRALHEAAAHGTSFGAQIMLPLPAGDRWFELSVARKRVSAGQRDTFVVLSRDISDRKTAEQALARHGDELERIVQERSRQLTEARDASERASKAKSEFLSRMSHELRTPMNAILGFSQLIDMDPASSTRSKVHVREILRAGKHLLHLINDVLDLEQVEAGRLPLHAEAVDLDALAQEAIALIQPLADQQGITLAPAAMQGLVVMADATRLKQVLVNLLSNAVKYNRAQGHVWLSAGPQGDAMVRIQVRDDGRGIAADRVGELFQPFNRLGAEAGPIEGSGIGLSLCRRLAELMRGSMGVDTREGAGSTFWIDLPRADLPAEAASDKPAESGQTPVGPTQAGSLPSPRVATVLYIEDNQANLQLMEQIVARHQGVTLISASTGQLGLAMARARRPDLILLDIHLPDMDGYAVLGQLRDDVHLRGTPVIAVTANAMPTDVRRIRDAGFDDYMAKPIRVTAMDLLIHEQLGSTLA